MIERLLKHINYKRHQGEFPMKIKKPIRMYYQEPEPGPKDEEVLNELARYIAEIIKRKHRVISPVGVALQADQPGQES